MEITGFRWSVTGAYGIAFYRGSRCLCTVSSLVVPSPTVTIRGFGREWQSPFDADSTLFPGLTRTVYRTGSGQAECRLVYRGEGYELQYGAYIYKISIQDGIIVFSAGGRQVAAITRLARPQAAGIPVPPDAPFDDMEARYTVSAADGLPDAVLMAVLAFPMLRFGE